MKCEVCEKEIQPGERYLPVVPWGYGNDKSMFSRGTMHTVHLSSSDWLSKKYAGILCK